MSYLLSCAKGVHPEVLKDEVSHLYPSRLMWYILHVWKEVPEYAPPILWYGNIHIIIFFLNNVVYFTVQPYGMRCQSIPPPLPFSFVAAVCTTVLIKSKDPPNWLWAISNGGYKHMGTNISLSNKHMVREGILKTGELPWRVGFISEAVGFSL